MASPACILSVNAGPFNPTVGGTVAPPSATIDFKLSDPVGVSQWTVRVIGSDELTSPPVLTGAHPVTGVVTPATATVSFTMPGAPTGRTVIVESLVQVGPNFSSDRFGVYTLTSFGKRIPAAGERVESNSYYGWAVHLNPLLRDGASQVYYNDTLVLPLLGTSHVQGALDALKLLSGGGGGGKAPIVSSLIGTYDGVIVPGFMDAPRKVTASGTMVRASVFRRYAGTSGTTRVNVLLNGVSVFGLPPTMPQVTSGAGDYAFDSKVLAVPVLVGDYVEFVLEEAETFSQGLTAQENGPEGLSALVEFT